MTTKIRYGSCLDQFIWCLMKTKTTYSNHKLFASFPGDILLHPPQLQLNNNSLLLPIFFRFIRGNIKPDRLKRDLSKPRQNRLRWWRRETKSPLPEIEDNSGYLCCTSQTNMVEGRKFALFLVSTFWAPHSLSTIRRPVAKSHNLGPFCSWLIRSPPAKELSASHSKTNYHLVKAIRRSGVFDQGLVLSSYTVSQGAQDTNHFRVSARMGSWMKHSNLLPWNDGRSSSSLQKDLESTSTSWRVFHRCIYFQYTWHFSRWKTWPISEIVSCLALPSLIALPPSIYGQSPR